MRVGKGSGLLTCASVGPAEDLLELTALLFELLRVIFHQLFHHVLHERVRVLLCQGRWGREVESEGKGRVEGTKGPLRGGALRRLYFVLIVLTGSGEITTCDLAHVTFPSGVR